MGHNTLGSLIIFAVLWIKAHGIAETYTSTSAEIVRFIPVSGNTVLVYTVGSGYKPDQAFSTLRHLSVSWIAWERVRQNMSKR